MSDDTVLDLGGGFTVTAPGRRMRAVLAADQPQLDEGLIGGPELPVDPAGSAAAAEGLRPGRTVVLTDETGVPSGDAVALTVPPPAPDTAQLLRYQDAAGLWHWAYPEPEGAKGKFVVPATAFEAPPVGPAEAGPVEEESLIGAVARKIVHQLVVYAYPIVDRITDPLVDSLAQQREIASHPYGVRTFTAANYRLPRPADADIPATPEAWARFAAGRTLLVLHGTFSTSHGGFGGLDDATVAALNAAYDGRVIAFDHPTVAFSLRHNIDTLLARTGAPGPVEVDILAHSRGGLVARELIRRQAEPGAKYRVRKVVFAATPNRGTALADPDHVVAFIDRYTNLLTLLPGPAEVVGDTLAGLMTAVQVLGHALVHNLDGLNAMCPGADTLRALDEGAPDTEYFAVDADFEPDAELLSRLRAGDLLMDAVFPERNDLVVPTGGVADVAPAAAAGFPVPAERRLHFAAERAVWHCTLFAQPETRAKLLEWLRP